MPKQSSVFKVTDVSEEQTFSICYSQKVRNQQCSSRVLCLKFSDVSEEQTSSICYSQKESNQQCPSRVLWLIFIDVLEKRAASKFRVKNLAKRITSKIHAPMRARMFRRNVLSVFRIE
jgi:hypothetical protein